MNNFETNPSLIPGAERTHDPLTGRSQHAHAACGACSTWKSRVALRSTPPKAPIFPSFVQGVDLKDMFFLVLRWWWLLLLWFFFFFLLFYPLCSLQWLHAPQCGPSYRPTFSSLFLAASCSNSSCCSLILA